MTISSESNQKKESTVSVNQRVARADLIDF